MENPQAPYQQQYQEPSPPESLRSGLVIGIIVIVVIIILGGGLYWYLQREDSDTSSENTVSNAELTNDVTNQLPTNSSTNSSSPVTNNGTNRLLLPEGETRELTDEEKEALDIPVEFQVTEENINGESVITIRRPEGL